MEVTRLTQARPDLDKRQRRGSDREDEVQTEETTAGSPDLYGMLGYRDLAGSSLTTQQWLSFRQIEL